MKGNTVTLVALAVVISLLGSASVMVLTGDEDDVAYIYTTMSWQQEMVQEIVGDTYEVKSFLKPNSDPHSSTLSPGMIVSGKAVAYFAIGSHVEWEENNLDTIKKQNDIPVFECCKELIEKGGMDELLHGGCHNHEHDHGGHDHAYDPHVWTSPERLKQIAEYVMERMTELDSNNKDVFEAGCNNYVGKVEALKVLEAELLSTKATNEIIVWHPSWAYLLPHDITESPLMPTSQPLTTPSEIMKLKGGTAEEPLTVFLSNELEIKGLSEKQLNDSGVYVRLIVLNVLASNWLNELEKAIITFGDELQEA